MVWQRPSSRPVRRVGALRQHGSVTDPDRRELEDAGWRTTLDYTENHRRARDGRLQQLHVVWRAVAERTRPDGAVDVIEATASSTDRVWSRLRAEAELAAVSRHCDPVATPLPAPIRPPVVAIASR